MDLGVVVWPDSKEREAWWREVLGIAPVSATGTATAGRDDSAEAGSSRLRLAGSCARRRSSGDNILKEMSPADLAWVPVDTGGRLSTWVERNVDCALFPTGEGAHGPSGRY